MFKDSFKEKYNFFVGLGECSIHGRVCLLSKSEKNEYGYFIPIGELKCEKCLTPKESGLNK